MGTDGWQYRVCLEWLAAGAKFAPSHSAKLVRLTTEPAEIVVTDQKTNTPIRAIAEFDDGTVEDVTALTVFSSNDEAVAAVSADCEVAVSRTGDTAIIARYSGGVTSTQVLVPAPDDGKEQPLYLPHNEIDNLVMAKLRKLNIQPSNLCSDGDFIRRVHLDAIGGLPTVEEARAFLVDRAPDKRKRLIDRLLNRTEYATYWAMKFSDWTGNGKYLSRYAMASNWMWQDWFEDKLGELYELKRGPRLGPGAHDAKGGLCPQHDCPVDRRGPRVPGGSTAMRAPGGGVRPRWNGCPI